VRDRCRLCRIHRNEAEVGLSSERGEEIDQDGPRFLKADTVEDVSDHALLRLPGRDGTQVGNKISFHDESTHFAVKAWVTIDESMS